MSKNGAYTAEAEPGDEEGEVGSPVIFFPHWIRRFLKPELSTETLSSVIQQIAFILSWYRLSFLLLSAERGYPDTTDFLTSIQPLLKVN